MSKFEVTFDDWNACVVSGDCEPRVSDSRFGRGRQPVINVTWDDAQSYVAWLSKMTGKTYRLLSEAEWEYAARAGTTTLYSFGDDKAALGKYAWYRENSDFETHPVGEKKPNAFGLHDMHGNVWEWVEDCSHDNYSSAPEDGSAWTTGGDCKRRALRGGAWLSDPEVLRSAIRGRADGRSNYNGFRVARTLTP